MNVIHKELKLLFSALGMMFIGFFIGIYINETVGITMVFILFPVAVYAFYKGQMKMLKHWKGKQVIKKNPDSNNLE